MSYEGLSDKLKVHLFDFEHIQVTRTFENLADLELVKKVSVNIFEEKSISLGPGFNGINITVFLNQF